MRSRDIIIVLFLLIFSGSLLYTASMQLEDINKTRKELKLVMTNEPLENAPPSLAFATVAMGAFRGLVVDILWMRADKLKEEGQFFDAKQLADWITILQPRFAAVWDFQAWNMAYNISVAMPATQPAERWKWVKNGYELLRDKGIEQNPNSIILYRSLAWIFQHKMGGVTDDVHKYYKMQLALDIRPLLTPNTNEHFERLNSAPKEFSEILKDEKVAELVKAFGEIDPEFIKPDRIAKNFLALAMNPTVFPEKLQFVIKDYVETDVLRKLGNFAQAYELRNNWKFDIGLMIKLNQKYGPVTINSDTKREPLNWEHPDAHAIYWAERGLEVIGNKGEYSIDEVNTDRIVFHSLHNLYKTGNMIIYSTPTLQKGDAKLGTEDTTVMMQTVFLRPDLRMFQAVDMAWQERIEKYGKFDKANLRPLRGGHRRMLENAVLIFYQSGHVKHAGKIYAKLRKLYPMPEFKDPIKVFCKKRMIEERDGLSIHDATEQIVSLLREAYFRFAVYDDIEASGREEFARELHKEYHAQMYEEGLDRVNLPEFSRLRYFALIDFINDQALPGNLKESLFGRIKIERPELYKSLEAQRKKFEKEYNKQQAEKK